MIERLRESIKEIFVGKDQVVEQVLICLLAGGHVLLEDVPGVGKTTLARTLAGAVSCEFGRIQFTPDTLPGDVTGTTVYNMKTGEFTYREGAVMHQILLADEINRTSPKTQASLLEAMAEGHVTVDNTTYPLPEPFMVLATQNPVEFAGTYPLPEAQLDRFMMRLTVGYPDNEAELAMARNHLQGRMAERVTAVVSPQEILQMREEVRAVRVSDPVLQYIRDIIELTRTESGFVLGASPRALLHLVGASQACAYLAGRDYVKPDDVKAVALNTLHHRLTLTAEARIRGEKTDRLLDALILKARVPMD
ncbi:MAG: MoxR family ATPase [Lachnospiraceae bacterium]|nr:MoxR family ATPase [Lachnospiraceae bacterium]